MKPISFLFGEESFSVKAEDTIPLLNLFFCESFPFENLSQGEERTVFSCSRFYRKRLMRLCNAANISLIRETQEGLPNMLFRYRKRWGLVLGVILSTFLLVLSEQFVWEIRVVGNESLTVEGIYETLAENGLSVGSYIPGIRTGELENRVLIASDEISWISVNFDGVIANVEVIESVTGKTEVPKKPANLVASADGQIELLQLFCGKPTVKIGQAVARGDLLVSGIYDSNTGGYRMARAAGEVLARTETEYTVEVPFSDTESEETGQNLREIILHFFGFSLKIFKNTGNDADDCDIIEVKWGFDRIGEHRVPIFLTLKKEQCRSEVPITRSETEALDLAYEELSRLLSEKAGSAQLLKKQISTEITEESLILHCTVTAIENIAEQVEIDLIP